MKILVINGPNLNFLGIREKKIYGDRNYDYLLKMIEEHARGRGVEVSFFQSNHEGAIIDRLQQAYFDGEDGIVINSPLASSVLDIASGMSDKTENGMHRIEPDDIARRLDPDEETAFRRYASSVQIGPDDEAFYRETRASYLINNYKMEKSELMNELSIAEKTGREDEITEIAGRLIHLDKLIDNINQTMEEYNA